jgi:hypothetical protein
MDRRACPELVEWALLPVTLDLEAHNSWTAGALACDL